MREADHVTDDLGLSSGGIRRVYTALCLMASCRGGASGRQRQDLRDYQEYLGIADNEAEWLQGLADRRDQLNLGKRKREQEFLIGALIDMAVADGRVDGEEEALLLGIGRKLRLSETDLKARLQEALERSGAGKGVSPDRSHAHAVARSAFDSDPDGLFEEGDSSLFGDADASLFGEPRRESAGGLTLGGHDPTVFDSDTGGLPELMGAQGDRDGGLFESNTGHLRSDERRGAAAELGQALDGGRADDSLPLGIDSTDDGAAYDDGFDLLDESDEELPQLMPDEPTEDLFGADDSLATSTRRPASGRSREGSGRRGESGPFGVRAPGSEELFEGNGKAPEGPLFGGALPGSSEELFGGLDRPEDDDLFGPEDSLLGAPRGRRRPAPAPADDPFGEDTLLGGPRRGDDPDDLFGDDTGVIDLDGPGPNSLVEDDGLFGEDTGPIDLGDADDTDALAFSSGFEGEDLDFEILEENGRPSGLGRVA